MLWNKPFVLKFSGLSKPLKNNEVVQWHVVLKKPLNILLAWVELEWSEITMPDTALFERLCQWYIYWKLKDNIWHCPTWLGDGGNFEIFWGWKCYFELSLMNIWILEQRWDNMPKTMKNAIFAKIMKIMKNMPSGNSAQCNDSMSGKYNKVETSIDIWFWNHHEYS